ncbi:tetratricopeptide repeat protein [Candidatus Omnitrophota bacterium]
MTCFAQEVVEADTADSKEFEQFDFANGLFERGLYEMAIAEYEKYQTRYPKGQFLGDVLLNIGESQYFNNDFDQAIVHFKAYLHAFPKEKTASLARLRLGQSYFFTDQFAEALLALNAIDRTQLDTVYHSILDYYLGRTHYRLGALGPAIKFLSIVTQSTQNDAPIGYSYFLLGDIFVKQQQLEDAIINYSFASLKSTDEKIASLALFRKGEVEFETLDYAASQKTFQAVMEKYLHLPLAVDAFANLLTVASKQERYKDVIAAFRQFDQKNAGLLPFNAYLVVVNAFLKTNDLDGALAVLAGVVNVYKMTPDETVQLYIKKVEILITLERIDEALEVILVYLKHSGYYQDHILFLEAEAYFKLQNWDKAQTQYQAIIDQYPQSEFADEAQWSLPLVYNQMGKSDQAVLSFLQYYEYGSDMSKKGDALYDVILLEVKLGKLEDAITHAREYLKAFHAAQHMERVSYLLGNLHQKLNQHDKAIVVFDEYIKNVKQSDRLVEVYFLLGFSRQALDKKEEALKAYGFVLESKERSEFYYSALKNSASIYLSQEKDDYAGKMFEKIILEFEEHDLTAETVVWLIDLLLRDSAYKRMVALLDRVETRKDAQYDQAVLAYYKGAAFSGLGDYGNALKSYEHSVSLDADGRYVGSARLGTGICYFEQKKFDVSSTVLRQLIEDYPDNHGLLIEARMKLAQIEEVGGNLEQAIKDYMLVAILYDDPTLVPQALMKAGNLFEKLEKFPEALSAYQEIGERFKASAENQEAVKKIELLHEK